MRYNIAKKLLSSLLAASMLISAVPVPVQASGNAPSEQEEDQETAEIPYYGESDSEDTETSTTFVAADGKKTSIFFQEAVRFPDGETGELKEYDPSLTEVSEEDARVISGLLSKENGADNVPQDGGRRRISAAHSSSPDYAYRNAQGDSIQYFPSILSEESPVIMTREDHAITLVPEEATDEVDLEEGIYTDACDREQTGSMKAVYHAVSRDIGYSYTSLKDGIKEDIILDSCPEEYIFTYRMELSGLSIEKSPDDESYVLYDSETGEETGWIAAPFMNDATGDAYSDAVLTDLQDVPGEEGVYLYVMQADASYLSDSDRCYPVTIDPSVTWKGNTDLGDVCVCNGTGYKDKNFYNSSTTGVNMKAGKGDKGVYRTYIAFKDLKTMLSGYSIDSAVFTMYETAYSNSGNTVQAYRVNGSWNRSSLNWNNRPGFDTLYDTVSSTGVNKKARQLDLTEYCRSLARNEAQNYGIMLKGTVETGKYCEFHGSRYATDTTKRPKLVVTYHDKPSTPEKVSVSPKYIRPGEEITLKWTGIRSEVLDHVQYRVCEADPVTKADGTPVIAYSSDTVIGDRGDGNIKLDTSGWGEGCRHIYVRGVDDSQTAGNGKGTFLYIDGTAPAAGNISVSPAGTATSPSASRTPSISWSGFTDAYLNRVEYRIGDGDWQSLPVSSSGSFTPDPDIFEISGAYPVTVRAWDKAGNSRSASYIYHVRVTPDPSGYIPADGLHAEVSYGKNVLYWETEKKTGKYIYFRIYRGSQPGFSKNGDSLVAAHVQENHWTDIDLQENDAYYKAELVVEDMTGSIQSVTDAGSIHISGPDSVPCLSDASGSGHDYARYEEIKTPAASAYVNMASGNICYTQEDAGLPSVLIPFSVERSYNSQGGVSGMFGEGWTDSLHKELVRGTDGTMYLMESDGSVYTFTEEHGNYLCREKPSMILQGRDSASGASRLVSGTAEGLLSSTDMDSRSYEVAERPDSGDPDGMRQFIENLYAGHSYTVKTEDGLLLRFGDGGNLVSVMEPNGSFLYYAYDQRGRLASVTTDTGDSISVEYGNSRRADRILLPDETSLEYSYNGNRLTGVSHYSMDRDEHISFGYGYDSDGKLGTFSDAMSHYYGLAYSGDRVAAWAGPCAGYGTLSYYAGRTVVRRYVGAENCVSEENVTFDSMHRVLSLTNAEGKTERYNYDSTDFPYNVTTWETDGSYEEYARTTGIVTIRPLVLSREYCYDDHGRLLSETGEDGSITEYGYGPDAPSEWNEDLPVSITETASDGHTNNGYTKTNYDQAGNIKDEVSYPEEDGDGTSTKTEMGYEDGLLVYEENFKGTDDNPFFTSRMDYSYDSHGNNTSLVTTTGNVTDTTEYVYDEMGRLLEESETHEDSADTNDTLHSYDYLGREISTTFRDEAGNEQTGQKTYDDNGSLVREVDIYGTVTEYTYDALNRMTGRTVRRGQESASWTTAYGVEDIRIHTLSGWEEKENAVFQKEYGPDGSLLSASWSDSAGRSIATESAGVRTDITYDASGNQTASCTYPAEGTGSQEMWTVSLYNEKGEQTGSACRPVIRDDGTAVIGDNSSFSQTAYDAKGNVAWEKDPLGIMTSYEYDELSRIISVTENAGALSPSERKVTTASYRTLENGTETVYTDASGHRSVELAGHDGLTMYTADEAADGQSITTGYHYDTEGKNDGISHEDGSLEVCLYDRCGRISTRYYTDGDLQETGKTVYRYDSHGRETAMLDYQMEDGAEKLFRLTARGYDAYGRTAWVSETDCDGAEPSASRMEADRITYGYDMEDRIISVTYPGSGSGILTEGYVYDAGGRITEITGKRSGGSTVTLRSYLYDGFGRVEQIQDHPGILNGNSTCIQRDYTYDADGRTASMTYKKGSRILEEYHYQYDLLGRLIQKIETNDTPSSSQDKKNHTVSYTYDALGRLVFSRDTDHRNGNAVTQTAYSYDMAGNRTGMTSGNRTSSYSYNGLHQLTASQTRQGSQLKENITYTYDENGNQTGQSDSVTGQTRTASYDPRNQIISLSISTPSGNCVQTCRYNGNGQRVEKDTDGTVTRYHYLDGSVSYTTGPDSSEKTLQYLDSGNGSIFLAEERSRSTAYYLYDKDIENSTTSLLDANGNGVVSYRYGDFGETETVGNGADWNEVCYTGGIYDQESGQYYLNARYYDPSSGRFLTEDSYRGEIGHPDTLHLYVYCANDPVNYVDPSGHEAIYLITVCGTIFIATYTVSIARTVITGKKYVPPHLSFPRYTKSKIESELRKYFVQAIFKSAKMYFSKNTKSKINKGLFDKNGNIDLGKFNKKTKTGYKNDDGWTIEKDRAGDKAHGGSKWKLKNKKGERKATLDEKGKILRK